MRSYLESSVVVGAAVVGRLPVLDGVAKGRSFILECEKHSQPVPLAPVQATREISRDH